MIQDRPPSSVASPEAARPRRGAGFPAGAAALALGILLAAVPFVPLLIAIPDSHDLPDHLAMASEFSAGLSEGQLYPRWYGRFNLGWGEPTAVFYPPALYYATALLSALLGGGLIEGLHASLLLATVVGMIGMFRLARGLGGPAAGLAACAAYILAPYRAFELYAAGLFSAYAAGCLLPWALLALGGLADRGPGAGSRSQGTLPPVRAWALVYALIVLTNLPSAVLLTYLAAFWAAFEAAATRQWRVAIRAAAGAAWGGLMAAVYLLAAVAEMPAIVPPMAEGPPVYLSNFVFQLHGGWMSPGLAGVFHRMGLSEAALLVLSLFSVIWIRRKRARGAAVENAAGAGAIARAPGREAVLLRLLITFAAATLFLATPISSWFWAVAPALARVNMPWRLLDHLAAPVAALAAAAALSLLRPGAPASRAARTAALASMLAILLLSARFQHSIFFMNGHVARGDAPRMAAWFFRRPAFFRPRGVPPADQLIGHPLVQVRTPGATAELLEWKNHRRVLRVTAPAAAEFALRTYYFPGWTARAIGEAAAARPGLTADPGSGAMVLRVSAGVHVIELSFQNTPQRTAGAWLSVIALAAWAGSLLRDRLRARSRTRRPRPIDRLLPPEDDVPRQALHERQPREDAVEAP